MSTAAFGPVKKRFQNRAPQVHPHAAATSTGTPVKKRFQNRAPQVHPHAAATSTSTPVKKRFQNRAPQRYGFRDTEYRSSSRRSANRLPGKVPARRCEAR
jgi:hypothetical protein